MEYYIQVLNNGLNFSGRSRRKEYWMFKIIDTIISFIIVLVLDDKYYFVGVLYALVILIPGLAVSVRRMHDIGKSGWWLLINLVPIIGWIWSIVWMAKKGVNGENKYGKNPIFN